jgi:hypothetical protein
MRTTARRSQRGLSIRGSLPGLAAKRERADGCEVKALPMRRRETKVAVYRGVAGAETVRVQVVCGEAAAEDAVQNNQDGYVQRLAGQRTVHVEEVTSRKRLAPRHHRC